jgi:hypothetical protein
MVKLTMTSLCELYLNVRGYERECEHIKFAAKAMQATRRWRLSSEEREYLDRLLGLSGTNSSLMLSNTYMRNHSRRLLLDTVREYFDANITPDTNLYFFTFACDVGFVSDRTPVVRLAALKSLIERALRKIGLSAIVQIEIQAIINYPQKGMGRTLMVHAHAIGWGDYSEEEIEAAVDELNRSQGWQNHLGAEPIKFRQLEGGTPEALILTYYLDKAPASGKNRIELRKRPGEFRFRDTQAGYRPELCLRIVEGLSQISITDAVFAVGEGKHVRRAWKARFLEWSDRQGHRGSRRQTPERNASFWKHVRTKHGSKLFEPYRFD